MFSICAAFAVIQLPELTEVECLGVLGTSCESHLASYAYTLCKQERLCSSDVQRSHCD
jgi:hypothetical protein